MRTRRPRTRESELMAANDFSPQTAEEESEQLAAAIQASLQPEAGGGGVGGGAAGSSAQHASLERPASAAARRGPAAAPAGCATAAVTRAAVAEQEETLQLERAIAESLRLEEQRLADRRYEGSVRLMGFIDSHREADWQARAGGQPTRAAPEALERERGRAIALRALEASV